MLLEELLRFDDLQKMEYESCPTFIHRDHRWGLCVLHHAQQKGWLSTPCDLVLFDQHHDGLIPICIDEIRKIRKDGPTPDSLLKLCDISLSKNDDDWLIAGIELGLIRNCVIFGVHGEHHTQIPPEQYVDHLSQEHLVHILSMPANELGYQGCLSDVVYREKYSPVWNTLRWRYSTDTYQFSFGENEEPIWVDFDLDVFAVNWSDYILPWNDHVFCSELLRRSGYHTTRGWSPRDFIQGLLDQAGLFTIATEPRHCGGFKNMLEILERFNHYVFDNSLTIPRLSEKDD